MGNGAAAVIIDERGRVLLVKHTYGRLDWALPGGNAEPGESAEATALREVLEETGLRVRAERLAGIYYEPEVDMHHFVFACRREDETAIPRPDGQEISAFGFWELEALPRPISDFTVRRIHDAFGGEAVTSIAIVALRQWLD